MVEDAEVAVEEEMTMEEVIDNNDDNDDNDDDSSVIAVVVLPSVATSSKCHYDYKIHCSTNGYSSMSTICFSVGETAAGSMQKYNATGTFFWGQEEEKVDGETITDIYHQRDKMTLTSTHVHGYIRGTFIVGYR